MQGVAKLKVWMQAVTAITLVTLLAACGGGGGGGGSSNSDTSGLPPSPGAQPVSSSAGNATPITVGQGVANVINIPTVSVTICAPGTTTCQTISNVQVDTGSYGLRIVNQALNSTMQTALTPAAAPAAPGSTLGECTTFADGFSWGSVRNATVQISGETATNIPIQILGDMADSTQPPSCVSGAEENTASSIGANGIIGIGVAPVDCGVDCSDSSLAPQFSNYYACNGSTCATTPTTVPILNQVANPVARFATDNNGVIVEMAPISATGQSSATGTLVFGINTATNNKLAAAQTFTTDGSGDLNASSFAGSTVQAFFDSGSNAYFFNDSTLPLCSSTYNGFYCPTAGVTRSVTLVGINGVTATANIGVLSAATLFSNGSSYAFNDLGGQVGMAGTFDIGLPFFFGRYMYYGFDQTLSGGQQPYVGY